MEEAFIRAEKSDQQLQHFSSENTNLRHHLDKMRTDMTSLREDSKAELDTLKSAYNTAVAELTENKAVGRQLLEQIETLEDEISLRKEENSRILKDFEDRNEEALNEMDKMVQGFEQEKSLFHDNIKHLEGLRDNLEKTVSEKTEAIFSLKNDLEQVKQKEELTNCKVEEVTKTNLRLKGNLELRATENLKLKEKIDSLDKEVTDLRTKHDDNQRRIKDLSDQKADVDRLRTAEMEMCCKLREKLARAETEAQKGESAVR